VIDEEDDDGTFTLPAPSPGSGLRSDEDVVFIRRRPEGRESEDIMLRSVPQATAQRFRTAAGGRAMTFAQYISALVELHEEIRARADSGDAELQDALVRLGLASVTV